MSVDVMGNKWHIGFPHPYKWNPMKDRNVHDGLSECCTQLLDGSRHVGHHGSTICAPKRRVMASNRLAKSDGTWRPIALRAARLITIATDRSTRLRAPTARPASFCSTSDIRIHVYRS